jgi:hypothetical protein
MGDKIKSVKPRPTRSDPQGFNDYNDAWLKDYTDTIAANEADQDWTNDKALASPGDYNYAYLDLPNLEDPNFDPLAAKDPSRVYNWADPSGQKSGTMSDYTNMYSKQLQEYADPATAQHARSNYDAASKAISDYTGRVSGLASQQGMAAPGLSALKAAQDRAARRLKLTDSGARRIYADNAGA